MAKPPSKARNVSGHYIPFYTTVPKSQAFKNVSNNAKLIFCLMSMGYNGYNNGSLVATFEGFKKIYGIRIAKRTFYKCINELIKAYLVFRVIKGHRGRVSRYALCIWPIDETDDVALSPTYKPGSKPITKYLKHEEQK